MKWRIISFLRLVGTIKGSVLQSELADTDTASLFLNLFEQDKHRLYAFIYAFVLDYPSADDIFQEVSMTLWREFEKYRPNSNFSKWANVIAFNRVLTFRQANKKYALGVTDDIVTELQAHFTSAMPQNTEDKPSKWLHLKHCVELLPQPLSSIYQDFYVQQHKAQEIANRTGRTIYSVRKAIHKLRKRLFDCVKNKENEDGA